MADKKTPDAEPEAGPGPQEAPESTGFALPLPVLAGLLGGNRSAPFATAEGAGALFEQTREFIEEHAKSGIVEVTDPDTGITVLATLSPGGGLDALPATFYDNARDNPRFRRGAAALTRIESFILHVNRFGDEDSVVFADDNRSAPKLTAVLDYHRADTNDQIDGKREVGEFRHGKHRTTFNFPLGDEWKAWNAVSGKVMSMADFAVFLEDRIGDIASAGDDFPEHVERLVAESGGPERIASYAALMELARGLHVYENAQVEEAINLASGEGSIRFSVEHETRTRTGGTVKVPKLFFIAIPVFAKGAFYRIAVRLRYRKTPEGVKFILDLYRPDLSFDHAFAEAVAKVEDETETPVLFGAPEA